MKLVVVVPTYNERDNVAPLLGALDAIRETCALRFDVLVVDDGSPDGTADAVQALRDRYAWLHLLAGGPKAGLGAAYARGIRHALEALGAEVVGQMDGDLSHRPVDLPRLIAAIAAGADVAIGSRYVAGGRLPEGWPARRRAMSHFANFAARRFAGLATVRDCTAGFRLLRRQCIDPPAQRPPAGYVYLVWLLEHAIRRGARVVEVPVDYVERTHGVSKVRLADVVEFAAYLVGAARRRWQRS